MARQMSEKAKRKKTEESLKNAVFSDKLPERFIEDKIDEYMSFYDDLSYLNEALKRQKRDGNEPLKTYMEATAEKRRISAEMRNILRFLGVKMTDVNIPGSGGQDEEL